jgi:hypothetical protein
MKIFTWALLILPLLLSAKVDPPNYNFSLDTFRDFWPGTALSSIQKKYEKGTIIKKEETTTTYRFYVAQLRYKFPIFIQVYQGQVLDFYGRLPTYFLHDVFHQSLINRFKQQDIYKKIEANAIYIWKNRQKANLIYSGTCTITCFPIYFAGISTQIPSTLQKYQSLWRQFSTQLPISF